MIVKEIVERPSGSNPPAPPQLPRPSSHQAGFPIARRRAPPPDRATVVSGSGSSNVKSFRNHRDGDQGERFAHENFSQPFSASRSTNPDEAQRQMEEDNKAKVAAMTSEERGIETTELLARFGGGLVEVMRKRREQREKGASSSQPGSSSEGGPSEIRTPSEVQRVRQEVSLENERQLQVMSEEERVQEMQDLEGRFGKATLEALKRRAEQRAIKPVQRASSVSQRESALQTES